jgi:hypothetical protein
VILGLAAAGTACSNSEKLVVDKYFRAVNAQDNQTLSSFAVVNFDKKVEAWKINSASPENRTPAPLPELVKKVQQIETDMAANKKAYNQYFLDHPNEVDQVRELGKKGAPIPAKLKTNAEEWGQYEQKERELKRSLAEARAAVERERRNVTLSVGQVEDIDTVPGEAVSKQVDMTLTIDGAPQQYVMTLRKYDLKPASGPRIVSRWVVQHLAPKA